MNQKFYSKNWFVNIACGLISFITIFSLATVQINKQTQADHQNVRIINVAVKAKNTDLATISIPKLHIKNRIYRNSTNHNLSRGIVQQYAKQYPGIKENYVLAGHNLIYVKKLFTNLTQAKPNMNIYISQASKKYIYRIKKVYIVNTSNIDYLKPDYKNKPCLTLYTCTNTNNPHERQIVESIYVKSVKNEKSK